RLAEADERYQSIERLGPTVLEIADAACDRISSLTFRGCPVEGVQLGLGLLRRLGVEVPTEDQVGPWIQQGLARLRAWTAEKDGVAADLARPEASDPHAAAAARLIARMIPPSFFVGMPIMPWLMLECQRLWAVHGPCAALVGPLCHAGFVTIMLEGDCRTAYDAVRRVIAVCEKHGYEPECSHAKLIFSLSTQIWFEPVEHAIDLAQRALCGLLQGGDQQNVGFAGYVLIPQPLECVATLDEYLTQINARLDFATSSGNDQTASALVGYRQLAKALLGRTAAPGSLADESFDPATHLADNASNPVAIANTHISLGIASAIVGDSQALAAHAEAAMALLPVYEATLQTAIVRVLRALALADVIRRQNEHLARQPRAANQPEELDAPAGSGREELDRCRQWLAQRASHASYNLEHLLHLIDAEWAWARGDLLDAARGFDKAMATVRGKQRPWHAALITERAARFHLAQGLDLIGTDLMTKARDLYQAWGAEAKVGLLEDAYPELPERTPAVAGPAGSAGTTSTTSTADAAGATGTAAGTTGTAAGTAGLDEALLGGDDPLGPMAGTGSLAHALMVADSRVAATSEAIDMQAIVRVCQVLSSETNLNRLHSRVREVLSATTGATSVRIVLRRDDPSEWFVPTAGVGETAGSGIPLSSPEGARLVPLLAFRYAERTLEPVLVADVAQDARFTVDPYIRKSGCRSLVVMPILSKGAPRAMLILEHNLSRSAFTADRLDAVRLIAGQLAVSLENAVLYEELERRVRECTQELHSAQSRLASVTRNAGAAGTGSRVLHAIGTVLTGANASVDLVASRTLTSTADALAGAIGRLRAHGAGLGDHLARDEEGRMLPEYLASISTALNAERRDCAEQLERLVTNLDLIMSIVAAQQPRPGGPASNWSEPTRIAALVEEAVRVNARALQRHRVTVVRPLGDLPVVLLDRLKVLLILTNLISNARAAVAAVPGGSRTVTISAELIARDRLRIAVTDSGEGIPPEQLSRIFARGFSTRSGGHGFGLHHCAVAAQEMGGTLVATSDGLGYGASFALDLPVAIAHSS
ncbi:MAG: GAF domain-containing protein, partial [Micromonosporaceae bacterium]|nr:GAF domain-containing protein [Micromonosporaceae bacterium]